MPNNLVDRGWLHCRKDKDKKKKKKQQQQQQQHFLHCCSALALVQMVVGPAPFSRQAAS